MSESAFDVFTRRAAAAFTRRASLATLGGAALAAAVSGPSITMASKAGKKAKKKCRRQKNQCEGIVRDFCASREENDVKRITTEGGEEEQCLGFLLPCCAKCNVTVGIRCFLDIFAAG